MKVFINVVFIFIACFAFASCGSDTPLNTVDGYDVIISAKEASLWSSDTHYVKSYDINEESCGTRATDSENPLNVLEAGVFTFPSYSVPSEMNKNCCEYNWVFGNINSNTFDMTPYKDVRMKFTLLGDLRFSCTQLEDWATVVVHIQNCSELGYVYYKTISIDTIHFEEDVELSLNDCLGATAAYIDIRVQIKTTCWWNSNVRKENTGIVKMKDLKIVGIK